LLRLRSGLQVRVVEAGPVEGAPVVLLPGWGASAFTFRHQLPALGAAGYRASAVDLKGHGLSDKPMGPREYTFEAMLRHAEEVIEAVASRPVILVAQSMAGPLGVELARGTPGTVSRLALVSPVGLGPVSFIRLAQKLTGRWLEPVAPRLAPRWAVRLALTAAYGDPRRVTKQIVREYWAPAQFPEFARALRALARDFAWSPLPDAQLAAVADRTLVLLGALDRLVRGAPSRANQLFGSRAILIPGAGHSVHEERPDVVNAALLEFLGTAA
jgi:pimeloyl-ACP methyl ester carboxylesterase